MSGGKGGSQNTTQTVEIPEWLEDAAKNNIALAEDIRQIGPIPYVGPTVAAFNPAQQAAFEMAGQAAEAYGMLPEGMTPQDMRYTPAPVNMGGMDVHTAQPMFDAVMADYTDRAPAQADYMQDMFIDPAPEATSPSTSSRASTAASPAASPAAGGEGTTYANWESFGRPWMSGTQLMAAVNAGTMTTAEANAIMRYQDRG